MDERIKRNRYDDDKIKEYTLFRYTERKKKERVKEFLFTLLSEEKKRVNINKLYKNTLIIAKRCNFLI